MFGYTRLCLWLSTAGNMLRISMKLFRYLKYYFQPNDKYVRQLAYESAKKYFSTPVRNHNNPYPRVKDYDVRREEFLRYQRAFNDRYRHEYAIFKLTKI